MTEKFEAPFGQYDTPEMKALRNDMQVELMGRQLGDGASTESELAWVKMNSNDFAEVLTAHPELLEEYRTGDRRRALEEMEERLGEIHESRFKKAA